MARIRVPDARLVITRTSTYTVELPVPALREIMLKHGRAETRAAMEAGTHPIEWLADMDDTVERDVILFAITDHANSDGDEYGLDEWDADDYEG